MAIFKINLNKVLNSGGSIKVRKSEESVTPTPTPSQTTTINSTPTPTNSVTPTATPTTTQTPTPTPTATPAATPATFSYVYKILDLTYIDSINNDIYDLEYDLL